MTETAEEFLHDLSAKFPDRCFEIMACRQNILEDNTKDVLVAGWLASSPTRKRGHNACVIQPIHGGPCIDVSEVMLDSSCAVYVATPAVHVGILAVAETYAVKEFYVFVDPLLCHEYWMQHQTIPNAHVLTSFILNHVPEVRTASMCRPLEPELRTPEETVAWMEERERRGFTFEGTTTSIVVPIGNSGLFLDLLTGGVNTKTAVHLTYPYPHNLKPTFGGILSGAPGAGKFTALAALIRREGGKRDMSEEDGLAAGCTLMLLPSQGFAHRSAQLHSALIGLNVVCVPTFQVLEGLSYADILSADVLAVAAELFSSKPYQLHACKFTSNIAWNPDWVLPMYYGLAGALEVEDAGVDFRKAKRQRTLPTLNRQSTLGEARTFFDQSGRGDVVSSCSGTEARDLPLDMFCNMTELVSKYLVTLPVGWEQILMAPVLELFKFHRLVFCELQNAPASFEGHLESLRANRRWLVDSSAFKFRFWSETSMYWEMVLDATVRDIENRCDKYALCLAISTAMASVPVSCHQECDKLPLVLYDAMLSSSENPAASLTAQQLPNIICGSQEQCVAGILFLQELAFCGAGGPNDVVSTLTSVLDYKRPVPVGLTAAAKEAGGGNDGVEAREVRVGGNNVAEVREVDVGGEDNESDDSSDSDGSESSESDDSSDDEDSDVEVVDLTQVEGGEDEEVSSDDDDDDSSEEGDGPPNSAEGTGPLVHSAPQVMKHVRDMQALGRRVHQELMVLQNAPCSICREGCLEAILPCGHSFCASCICAWVALENVCPTCMAPGGPSRTPIFIPIPTLAIPLPDWCPDDSMFRTVWQRDVCSHHPLRIPVFAFWLLVHLLQSERAGLRALIVCKSKARCKNMLAALDVLSDRYSVWKGCATDVDAPKRHCVSKLNRVAHGPRMSDVCTVLMTCPVEPDEREDIFLRLRNLGNAVVMRSCAFEIGNP